MNRARRLQARRAGRLLATLVSVAVAGAAPRGTETPTPASEPACDASVFAPLSAGETTIQSVERIPAGGFTPPRGQAPLGSLPAFCRVQGSVTTSADSMVTFDVWLPADWNGKLVVTGNGGYSNIPNYGDMAYALAQGYAVVGGDTGHQTSTPDDLLWGAGHPERILDWGTRSIHVITRAATRSIERATSRRPRRAYFYGCSTGGHQGFAEIQHYPQDFDGVIAGAPGHNRVRLNAAFLWRFLANHRPGDETPILPASKLPLVTKAVVAACDGYDGVTDGVIDDPRTCRFDPNALECKAGDGPGCLTSAQIAVLNRIYAGPKSERTGAVIYPGWTKGSEALTVGQNGMPLSGWHQYWGTTEPVRASFWRSWVFENPNWNWWESDFDPAVELADRKVGKAVDQVNADINGFKRRGGKAIVYHGWQDPVANALDTIAYYERVRQRQGSQQETDRFFRLFLVPGMGHCAGGTGATSFGNQNAASPVVDAGHDLLSSLDAWVEKGVAPDRIVASRVADGAVLRTRPLCPYPKRAVYVGKGSTDEASSFVCR